jgi:hypothetical protein
MFLCFQFSPLRVLTISGLILAASSGTMGATPASEAVDSPALNQAQIAADYGKLPLSFEENRGQAGESVKFLSQGRGYSLFLTGSAAVLTFTTNEAQPGRLDRATASHQKPPSLGSAQTDVIRMELLGTQSQIPVTGADRLPGTANYFIGSDPTRWHSSIPTFSKVRYTGVYPGVDLVYYGNQGRLEYDFVIGPRADPAPICLHFAGAQKISITLGGDLVISTKTSQIAFHKPLVYQERDGRRQAIPGSFTLLAGRTVSFRLGSYDRSQPLVIDPVLVYSTYIGGTGFTGDEADAIAVDKQGNAYMTGVTTSSDFPLAAPYQKTNPFGFTAFVTKLNPAGTALVYSTYLGGTRGDHGHGIAVDGSGNAYVVGETTSPDFPVTAGAFQTTSTAATHGLDSAFITKLNPAGSALVYSTFLSGSGVSAFGDIATCVVLDSLGDAYVAGSAYSTNFPVTSGAYQKTNVGAANTASNVFVTKLNPAGSALLYSTYIGGSGIDIVGDQANALAVDASGNAYVTGYAYSANFPTTPGAFQTTNHDAPSGGYNAFVTKLSPAGSALVYSTMLGGSGFANQGDSGSALAIDGSGNTYIAGYANSTNFPVTAGAFQTSNLAALDPASNAFVTKLNPTGTGLIYSTYIGGSGRSYGDSASGLALDGAGNAYITGSAGSTNFPITVGAFQTTNNDGGGTSPFITVLNAAGNGLHYSTFIGGNSSDSASGLVLDGSGDVYITGTSYSANYPVTLGAFQTTNRAQPQNGTNLFVSKFSFGPVVVSTTSSLSASSNPQVAGSAVTFTAKVAPQSGNVVPTGSVVFSVDGVTAATVTLDSAATAAYTTSTLAVGAHTIKASYGGSAAFAASSASLTETIKEPQASVPIFSPAVGTYTTPQMVTLTDATKGAVIYYTTNGTTPSTSSTKYTAAINVSSTTTIEATAVAAGYLNSIVASGTYTIHLPVVTATLSPASLTFAATAVGSSSATQAVTLKNTGTSTLTITSGGITITGTGAASFSKSTTCGSTLAVGASCTISVAFKPTAIGSLTATLDVADNATGSPQKATLTGTGSAAIVLTPSPVAFPNTVSGTTSQAQVVTVKNAGSSTVTLTSVSITGTTPTVFEQINNCGASLVAGANCSVVVAFKPASATALMATLSIADSAFGSPQTVALSGTGATQSSVKLSATSLTFASTVQGTTSVAQPVTLTNTGASTLDVYGIAIAGTNASSFIQLNNCGAKLAPAANCEVLVAFRPTATGTLTGTLTTTDTGSASPQTVKLTGTGTP